MMMDPHAQHVRTINDCRSFFLSYKKFLITIDEMMKTSSSAQQRNYSQQQEGGANLHRDYDEENDQEESQTAQNYHQQKQNFNRIRDREDNTNNNYCENDILHQKLLREISLRMFDHQELVKFPFVNCLRKFHCASIAYFIGDSVKLNSDVALPAMQNSILFLLRRRLTLLMHVLYCHYGELQVVDQIVSSLIGSDGYFEERVLRQAQKSSSISNKSTSIDVVDVKNLVSDVAPLLIDLPAFEIGLVELFHNQIFSSSSSCDVDGEEINDGNDNNESKKELSSSSSYDFSVQFRNAENLVANSKMFFKKDEGLSIDACVSQQEFFSGFAGATTSYVSLWRENNNNNQNNTVKESAAAIAATKSHQSKYWRQQQKGIPPKHNTPGLALPCKLSKNNLVSQFLKKLNSMQKKEPSKSSEESNNQNQNSSCCSIVDDNSTEIREEQEQEKQNNSAEENNNNLLFISETENNSSLLSSLLLSSSPESFQQPGITSSNLPFQLLLEVFSFLLPSELCSAAITCKNFQKIILSCNRLCHVVELSLTFTRRISFFLKNEWGSSCIRIATRED